MKYLLNVYQPDGPPPEVDLAAMMRELDTWNADLRAANASC